MTLIDVAIIGAGASGSTAAFHLANKGNKVVLLEKNKKIYHKQCGGGIASSAQKWFPFDLNPIVDEIINEVEFTYCLTDPVIATLPGNSPFWIVKRKNLDSFLTTKAINEGTELLTEFQVVELKRTSNHWEITSSDGREIESKSVVIADGSQSPWPKKLKLGPNNQHYASTCSLNLKGHGEMKKGTARFEFGMVHHGFAWAFPLSESVSIGVGSFLGNKNKFNPKEILDKLLPNLGFCPSKAIYKEAPLRVWNGHSLLHGEGIIVVGDAASLCDPFLAEGLRPALMSGYEAAQNLNHWLKGDIKDLKNYSFSIKSQWGESMAWGKRISRIFYRFPQAGYNLGIKRPTAPKRIAQILSGEMSYNEIAKRTIKRLLFKN